MRRGRPDGASLPALYWEKASLGLRAMGRVPFRDGGLGVVVVVCCCPAHYGGGGFVENRGQADSVPPSPSPFRFVVGGVVVVSVDSLLFWSVPLRHGIPGPARDLVEPSDRKALGRRRDVWCSLWRHGP
jgi:hypothetical protein